MSVEWKETRSALLAAASAASAAAIDLIEFSRDSSGTRLTRPNICETAEYLIDALRLTLEAREDQADEVLLATLDKWVAENG